MEGAMRKHQVKCWCGNYDGIREGLVLAVNQREAAAAAHTTVYSFRQYWSRRDVWPLEIIGRGFQKPNTLYTRLFDSRAPWSEGLCSPMRGK